ncbi:uncharacterized protein LOC143296303 [Babylonia areolata]|uniref:uncharacterized protein LOC143296303 n=1 Tax=Babylonia areolata TaxID=304850 RepID=UPI003FD4A3CE
MGSLQERAVTLINQPPSVRTARDIEMVLPWLQKRSKLLMELERDTLKDILRHCSYEKATTDDVILKQGEVGDKFYVIMTGRVSVYIITKTDDDQAAAKASSSSSTTTSSSSSSSSTTAQSQQETSEAAQGDLSVQGLDRTVFGKFIMFYEAGTSFGEIALMSDEATRNASIIADEDTDLLVIDRALFNRSVKAKEEAAFQERVQFIQRNALFGSWTEKPRRLLEMSLRKEVHPFGSIIMRQGQPAHGLVFILSGQVRVSMEPSRHEVQFPSLLKPPPDPLTTANKKPAVRDRAKTPKVRRTHAQIEVRRQEGYAAAEQRMRGRTVDLCSLEKNEVFGDAEMVLDLETNMATLVSTATTEVFVLNAKNYERLVAKKHPHTVRLLLENVCQKLAARLHSSKASQLPILSGLHATASAKQRRLQASHRPWRRRAAGKGDDHCQRPAATVAEQEEEKSLVRMFLQGKAPLIKPCVPDSLYYREASASKTKVLLKSPYAKLRTLNMLNTYTTLRRKVPRSIQQLKGNVKAERELLGQKEEPRLEDDGHDDDDYDDNDDDDDHHHQTVVSPRRGYLPPRPASAAPGVYSSRMAVRPFASARPRSAVDMRIVPCQDQDDSPWGAATYGVGSTGGTGRGGEEDSNTLDHSTVSEIFLQMEAMQRDKNENRIRVLYTNSARSELRTKLEREPAWAEGGGTQGYEELYEDSFYDWETSDGNLRDLEARIASFCSSQREPRPAYSRSRPAVTHMKRYEVEDPNNIPLAGGTVFVHQKPCPYLPATSPHHQPHHHHHHHRPHSSVSTASSSHSHVRRFMLQREKPSQVFFGS